MNEPVYAIVGSDEPPETACSLVSDFSAWKLYEEAMENTRLETLEREALASPPYLYRGGKNGAFPSRRRRGGGKDENYR